MSTEASDGKRLHLPDLVIKGFRGIEDLTVSRLGRVNLISGRNGVGKTTLLEAVQLYAGRGQLRVMDAMLRGREEFSIWTDERGNETIGRDFHSLYPGRQTIFGFRIAIGPVEKTLQLSIGPTQPSQELLEMLRANGFDDFDLLDTWAFSVEFQGVKQEFPMSESNTLRGNRSFYENSKMPEEIRCEILGPGLLSNADTARFWDRVALTADETRAVDALNLIFDGNVERVAMVGDNVARRSNGRRSVVKLAGDAHPVPLKSLGDGAARLFGIALALANSKDGFLLIDEVENGIHYSVQYDFWKMVLRMAYENNVQVFATTHSWDCIRSFAYAAMETEEVEGTLVRLHHHRRNSKVRAIEYSESDLRVIAEQGIEVR